MRRRKKYIVFFVRKEQESYTFLRKKRVSPSTKLVVYTKKNVHVLDLSKPSVIIGSKYIYLIDINASKEGGQLRYKGSNIKYDAGILSFITVEGGIRQLTATLHDRLFDGNTIMLMIIGIALGVFIGIFAGGFF